MDMFCFNSDKYDFWKIYESIKQYYPIGIKRDGGLYSTYSGIKELEKIIEENIHDENNFNSRWENFTKKIETEVGKEIIGTTYGQAPSFSSYILVDQVSLDNLTRTKELHFFVSLVGPYYTIVGQDNNTVKVGKNNFRSTNYLIVSPENEFSELFTMLCSKIESQFKGFRFIPFEICAQTIGELNVKYSNETRNTVFHALFNDHIDFTVWKIIGDVYFKFEDWIKEGYVDDGNVWVVYPPNQ